MAVFLKLAALVVVGALAAAGWISGIGRDTSSPPPASASTVQPQTGEQTIQITEADLNQRLSQKLVGQPLGSTPLGTATLERITTQLTGGHLRANGDAKVGATSVPVSLTASGTVQNGRAIVSVDDLTAAGVPMPDGARQSVRQALQAQLDDAISRQQMKVNAISIDNGRMVLTGTR